MVADGSSCKFICSSHVKRTLDVCCANGVPASHFFRAISEGVLYDSWPYCPFVVAIVATAILPVLVFTKPFKEG